MRREHSSVVKYKVLLNLSEAVRSDQQCAFSVICNSLYTGDVASTMSLTKRGKRKSEKESLIRATVLLLLRKSFTRGTWEASFGEEKIDAW